MERMTFAANCRAGLRWIGAGLAACVWLSTAPVALAEDYIVGVGDKLSISIFGREDFSNAVEVRGDGTIRLHHFGRIGVTGKTLAEIEEEIAERAADQFEDRVSVVAGIAEYRPIFVMGNVQAPGSYKFAPGMTVIKAIALAGGYERAQAAAGTSERAIVDAQRRALDARIRLEYAEDEQKSIVAELARLTGEGAEGAVSVNPDQVAVYSTGRAILEETIEGYRRRSALAEAETGFYAQRREILARQLSVIEQQLEDVSGLVNQGLTRRDRLIDLQVDLDNYRSDELETLAFAAKAEQTGANAESEIGVARSRYHRDLLRDKIEIDQRVALLRSDLNTAMDFLRSAAPTSALVVEAEITTTFEIYRNGHSGAAELVELTSAMQPDDVLVVSFGGVSAGN